jgi:hypothetical protein
MSRKSKLTILSVLAVIVVGITLTILYIQKLSLPDYGTTTGLHGNVTNLDAQNAFVNAYLQGNPGRWQKIVYTIEGDPIIYTIRYNNQPASLEISIDTRHDMWSALKRIRTYSCQKMIASDEIRLTGCANVSNGEIVVP